MEPGTSVTFHPILFPPIPEDTAEYAAALFSEEYVYVRLGRKINSILFDLSQSGGEFLRDRSAITYYMYALLTVFQYVEGLTNRQLVEATHTRVDFKYALRLPLNYPNFDPGRLCEFRQQIYRDPIRQQVFQELLYRLAGIGLLEEKRGQSLCALEVLRAVCTNTRLETVLEAVFQVLETLAVTNSEWLRQITLPHWYERYSGKARLKSHLTSNKDWNWSLPRIGQDIQYLLAEIDRAEFTSISSLQEVQDLRRVAQDQFEGFKEADSSGNSIQFRTISCASCDRWIGSPSHMGDSNFVLQDG